MFLHDCLSVQCAPNIPSQQSKYMCILLLWGLTYRERANRALAIALLSRQVSRLQNALKYSVFEALKLSKCALRRDILGELISFVLSCVLVFVGHRGFTIVLVLKRNLFLYTSAFLESRVGKVLGGFVLRAGTTPILEKKLREWRGE